jgi:hypothetical protein
VLPAALAGLIAVGVGFHWVATATLGGEEIRGPGSIRALALLSQGLLGPAAFVYAGARTAPARQTAVAIVLALLVVAGAPLLAQRLAMRMETGVLGFFSNGLGCLGGVLVTMRRATNRARGGAGLG